jgi:hypothetical protein
MAVKAHNKEAAPARIHVRDGLSQDRRRLAALQAGYFNLDDLRFEQLLSLVQDYARFVRFHDTTHDDDIDPLQFRDNELVVMCGILSVDLTQVEQDIRLRIESLGPEALLQDTSPTSPLGLMRQFDEWFTHLRHPQSHAGELLYSLMESVVRGLRSDVRTLFLGIPDEHVQLISSHLYDEVMAGDVESRATPATIDVRTLYASLFKAIDMLQTGCRDFLPISLECQQHDPALALRAVFAQLYKRLQDRLNRFTLNFVDFYFTDVLQARPQPLKPDSVYLIAHPVVYDRIVEIPPGTHFLAGVDSSGQDILYAADDGLAVNDAQVEQIHSVFFSGRETIAGQRLSDGCWLDQFKTVPDADKRARSKLVPRPLFGAEAGELPASTAHSARLGVVIAHRILALREGRRKVTVDISFQELPGVAWSKLKRILNDLPGARNFAGRGTAREKAKFFAYFAAMFEIGVTAPDGWHGIREFKPAYSGSDEALKPNTLRLSFNLGDDAPAIVPYAADIHGEDFPTTAPLLRILLKDNYQQYAYDLLKDLVIRDVRIAVSVQGCRDLVLYNNIGQLSALAPFTPFGPLPDLGSYFIAGSREICNKQLTDLSIDIEWKGLPDIAGGFGEWYHDYPQRRESPHFVVSASVLADGVWQPKAQAPAQHQRLFASEVRNGDEFLVPQQRLSATNTLQFHKLQDLAPDAPLDFTPHTKNGLFKFTLQGPPGAFGHREYMQVMASTLTHNARVKVDRLARPLPNAPYTPEIASIRLNYSAVARLSLQDDERSAPDLRDRFIHLHPLGWEAISPLRHPRIHFMPQYRDKGTLFIGIRASECSQVSLLFHLFNDSRVLKPAPGHETATLEQAPRWSWLADNQWHPLPQDSILDDSTHGFKTAGIVTVRLPREMNARNTILPPNLYWLAVSANEQLDSYSHVSSIYAQAFKATWVSGQHPPSRQPMVLPPDSIERARDTLIGLAGVSQVVSSFGGVPAEEPAALRTRISERLRHKHRALTPLDYEMLILQEFPQVYKVKCFANVSSANPGRMTPGHLLIIPVPYLNVDDLTYFKPQFDGYQIQRIRDFVVSLAPAFSRIAVENPLYEEIQVRCVVQFKKGRHPGKYQNLLQEKLCEYLSPWSTRGNGVHFGWRLSEQEIKSYLHNLPYVDHIGEFSLLRVAPGEQGTYIVNDTAFLQPGSKSSGILTPNTLWSTAVPLSHHYVVSAVEKQSIDLQTGYDELEIGSTFIISQ